MGLPLEQTPPVLVRVLLLLLLLLLRAPLVRQPPTH